MDGFADPIALFRQWLAEARAAPAVKEPTAMTLATADPVEGPDARIVLLKACDADGFVFYTNLESPKAEQLAAHPRAALCFWWEPLARQVRLRGFVERVSDADADAYFATRPRLSQLGAWASEQSRPLPNRRRLLERVARYGIRFGIGAVPRPPNWGGYRLVPHRIEFWRRRPWRLHERVVYERAEEGWTATSLYP